ncbi:DNA-(apurinic or apyrimidinic site) lyase /endonuclease III [Cohaesibacter sp. ES.047]|uniref:endonuclease III n=1 Tax=Cohaesibacter sp. ES.047 TaxID=1798205 RepID=UPI000BC0A5D8|nr:endonuclease III [Cohaesibacter sp. ES.047]SNY90496.1 DNA-(apurinic or apyrimidinic site) lyase /endonuclease III [Cohaesibacter sp. ES.047]
MSDEKKPAAKKKATAKTTRKKPVRRRKWSKMSKEEIETLFARFQQQRPNPRGELDYTNAFTLLVAVVLSAQATDVGVNKATGPLFAIADTPEKMVALGEDTIRDYIKTIGLYRNKAKNVFLLSQKLIEAHGGEVPDDRDALVALPGVGRKTANVVLNIFFGQPTIAVDTHIFRLANRLELAPGKTVEEVEMALEHVIPAPYIRHSHHWLILHGRYVCKARKPDCKQCIVADLCRFKDRTYSVPAPIVVLDPYENKLAKPDMTGEVSG